MTPEQRGGFRAFSRVLSCVGDGKKRKEKVDYPRFCSFVEQLDIEELELIHTGSDLDGI